MSTGGGSQLDAYLERFNMSPVPGKVPDDNDKGTDEGHRSKFKKSVLSSCTSLFTVISLISTEIFLGFLRDIALATEFHSNSPDELEVSLTAYSINCTVQSRILKREDAIDYLRRGVLTFFLLSLGMHLLQSDRQSDKQFMIFYIVNQFRSTAFGVSLFLTIFPILLGIFLSQSINSILQCTKRTENSTISVLGWIKKVQLISLGRQITHPMAPIAKIEEAARELYGDMTLSLPEMRRALKSALLTLDVDLLAALKAFYEGHGTTFFECEFDDTAFLHTDIPSTSQLQLLTSSIFKNRINSCYRCIHSHVASRSIISGTEADDHYRQNISWFHLLRLPILLLNIAHSVDRLQKKLNLICREVLSDSRIDEMNFNLISTQDSNASKLAATRYAEIRLNLLRQMLKVEGDLSRLWLCERALSSTAMTSLLLPIPITIAMGTPPEESQETEDEKNANSNDNRVNIASVSSSSSDQRAKQAIISLNESLLYLNTFEGELNNKGKDYPNKTDETGMNVGLEDQIKSLISILSHQSHPSIPDPQSRSDGHISEQEPIAAIIEGEGGLCGVNKELGSNSGITLFESNDSRYTHHSLRMDTLRGIERIGDDNERRRIVDVYAATVTMLPPAATEKYRSIRSIESDSNNESKRAKMLLSELQKHIEMLDMTNGIVERIQNNDNSNDNSDYIGECGECDSKNVPVDSAHSKNFPVNAGEKSEKIDDCGNEINKIDPNAVELFESSDTSNSITHPPLNLYTVDLSNELSLVLSGLEKSSSFFFNSCENYGNSSDDDDDDSGERGGRGGEGGRRGGDGG